MVQGVPSNDDDRPHPGAPVDPNIINTRSIVSPIGSPVHPQRQQEQHHGNTDAMDSEDVDIDGEIDDDEEDYEDEYITDEEADRLHSISQNNSQRNQHQSRLPYVRGTYGNGMRRVRHRSHLNQGHRQQQPQKHVNEDIHHDENNNNSNGSSNSSAANSNSSRSSTPNLHHLQHINNDSSNNNSGGRGDGNGRPQEAQQQLQQQFDWQGLLQTVQDGLDAQSGGTVQWRHATPSLRFARENLHTHREARHFVEMYMARMVSILLEQQAGKINDDQRTCVSSALNEATAICAADLQYWMEKSGNPLSEDGTSSSRAMIFRESNLACMTVLYELFNKKRNFYKGAKQYWNMTLPGAPEVRIRCISDFARGGGFRNLAQVLHRLSQNSNPTLKLSFPNLEQLLVLSIAVEDYFKDCVKSLSLQKGQQEPQPQLKGLLHDAMGLCSVIMDHLGSSNEDVLKSYIQIANNNSEDLGFLSAKLKHIHEYFAQIYPEQYWRVLCQFYTFWRELAYKLISANSLIVRLAGWAEVTDLIESSSAYRPPPRQYLVENAGTSFVNGIYNYAGKVDQAGHCILNGANNDVMYTYKVPPECADGAGKCITLFRCTMRSNAKWWFLSEADEDQPGTDKDIDYYQHKSSKADEEQATPPRMGWSTVRNSKDPPPILTPIGSVVPSGREWDTFEWQLAKWAVENQIIEKFVLGDLSVHREVVARSQSLIKFLANMWSQQEEIFRRKDSSPASVKNSNLLKNKFVLQLSHLQTAWKTCINKTDSAVSNEIYHLLVAILPILSEELGVGLLSEIQTGLDSGHLSVISEFCGVLTNVAANQSNDGTVTNFTTFRKVREHFLDFLYNVLVHVDSPRFLSDNLSMFRNLFRLELLLVEDEGKLYRKMYLGRCVDGVKHVSADQVDEEMALRLVELVQFLLNCCPHDQQIGLLSDGKLPTFLFDELLCYIKRGGNNPLQLQPRLNILHNVYTLHQHVTLSYEQVDHLWRLCEVECVYSSQLELLLGLLKRLVDTKPPKDVMLTSDSGNHRTATLAFRNLFCTLDDWSGLTHEGYCSFRTLYRFVQTTDDGLLLKSNIPTKASTALDTLWRIFMTCLDSSVAEEVKADLLQFYSVQTPVHISGREEPILGVSTVSAEINMDDSDDKHCTQQKVKVPRMQPASPVLVAEVDSSVDKNDTSRSFLNRILECLKNVLKDYPRYNGGSEDVVRTFLNESSARSAERCLRLLHSALGHSLNEDGTTNGCLTKKFDEIPTSSSRSSKPFTVENKYMSLHEIQRIIPHGCVSQSSHKNISVVVRCTNNRSNVPPSSKLAVSKLTVSMHPLENIVDFRQKISKHFDHPLEGVKCASQMVDFVDGAEVFVILAPVVPGAVTEHGPQLNSHNPMNSQTADSNVWSGNDNKSHANNVPLLQLDSFSDENLFQGMTDDDETNVSPGDKLFHLLLNLLEALPSPSSSGVHSSTSPAKMAVSDRPSSTTISLVWSLLKAMPTNRSVRRKVCGIDSSTSNVNKWQALICNDTYASVYTMQALEGLLSPSHEAYLHFLPHESTLRIDLPVKLELKASEFRSTFIKSGGFQAVLNYFNKNVQQNRSNDRAVMGYGVALRIIKCCLISDNQMNTGADLLNSLVAITPTLSEHDMLTSISVLNILLPNERICNIFVSGCPDELVMQLLLWKGSIRIRESISKSILSIAPLAKASISWFVRALEKKIDFQMDVANEFFDVLKSLLYGNRDVAHDISHPNADVIMTMDKEMESEGQRSSHTTLPKVTQDQMKDLCTAICAKLSEFSESSENVEKISLRVLCGLISALNAVLVTGGSQCVQQGVELLKSRSTFCRWGDIDDHMVDLASFIFDGFLLSGNLCDGNSTSSSGGANLRPICHDQESRQLGFEVVLTAISLSKSEQGYKALVGRLTSIIEQASLNLRHKFGSAATADAIDLVTGTTTSHGTTRHGPISTKFSGLRNQGCTCYMNSLLQQLFMMRSLREKICEAPLPVSLRSNLPSGTRKNRSLQQSFDGKSRDPEYQHSLVGKRISLQWESGTSYEARVDSYDEVTGMHVITYATTPVIASSSPRQQFHHRNHGQRYEDKGDEHANGKSLNLKNGGIAEWPDEFNLYEGRPHRETGIFEIVEEKGVGSGSDVIPTQSDNDLSYKIEETEEQISTRKLLEELQKTFVYLKEQRGRCYDPRSLVEASHCLNLQFDVWQQNDASEYATQLFDRLEVPLKKWAPEHFRYLSETFGCKQTKQKICKECGLKTNKDEPLMNIDLQIRGKSSIHESLSSFCEVEFMCGDNQVECDNCAKKCDTVLRTAISKLPNVLILSLKRFDLDYATFETVKLNSRCAFEENLNIKQYTLEGIEEIENGDAHDGNDMAVDSSDPKNVKRNQRLNDEDYEYNLVGVLVHAGVAQGGHYFSYIKDRDDCKDEKWYRFDDDEVTPFNPKNIESECFGGKIKKETKWPNGTVSTTETEQFANALMLFYEKKKPCLSKMPLEREGTYSGGNDDENMNVDLPADLELLSGYEAFKPDVDKTNTTHFWHAFLFDNEFQSFMKSLLNIAKVSSQFTASTTSVKVKKDWQLSVLQLCLLFFFDVILHTADRESRELNEWTNALVIALHTDKEGAHWFLTELVRRMEMTSNNWLRTYYTECPEIQARTAAHKVFVGAFLCVVKCPKEQAALQRCMMTIKSLQHDHNSLTEMRKTAASPMSLDSDGVVSEPTSIGKLVEASIVASFIHCISKLLEFATRRWPFCSEICNLIRCISSTKSSFGGQHVREFLKAIDFPAQLVCLLTRDSAPKTLRDRFAGSSLSHELGEASAKGVCDSPHTSQLPLLSGMQNQTNVSNSLGASFLLNVAEESSILESICVILEIKGCEAASLTHSDYSSSVFHQHSRPIDRNNTSMPKLTKEAKAALVVVFQEFKHEIGSDGNGLSQSDIQKYMERCGIENVPPQRIVGMLNKYPTEPGDGGKITRKLSLEGFLAYYRDTSSTNDIQVRSDLHTFGFRQDLSRRSESLRRKRKGGGRDAIEYVVDNIESIVMDVESTRSFTPLSDLCELGLTSFSFYACAYTRSESLASYLLATVGLKRRLGTLLVEALEVLSRTPTNWGGSETSNVCQFIFKVLVALPDEFREERLNLLFNCNRQFSPYAISGVGLLVAAKEMSHRSPTQRFATEFRFQDAVDRYIEIVRDLYSCNSFVKEWMDERENEWIWIRDWQNHSNENPNSASVVENEPGIQFPSYANAVSRSINHSQARGHSTDTEIGFVQDEESDDDYSPEHEQDLYTLRDRVQRGKCPRHIRVDGAGISAINGRYVFTRNIDSCPAYEKNGFWNNKEVTFTLYRWTMQEDGKSWFISILPPNANPGGNTDVDFYCFKGQYRFPPVGEWSECRPQGRHPNPTIRHEPSGLQNEGYDSDSVDDDEEDVRGVGGDLEKDGSGVVVDERPRYRAGQWNDTEGQSEEDDKSYE